MDFGLGGGLGVVASLRPDAVEVDELKTLKLLKFMRSPFVC
jgi:hypothetical protein